MTAPTKQRSRLFQFERDTFAFRHELVWQYQFDPVTGAMSVSRTEPPPTYYHRCFVVVRSVRQFFYHSRFEPGQPLADAQVYRKLIREVVSRSPRRVSADAQRVRIPGYNGLRSFSVAHEPLLKAECGGPWQSYFLRSHWRMVFPVMPHHEKRVARRLERSLREGGLPIVHLFRFPRITINHGIVLFGLEESEEEFQFTAYDPNIPAHPVKLTYDRNRRRFSFPPACYWPGGTLSVIEIFRSGLF